jgi:hypothetical protein
MKRKYISSTGQIDTAATVDRISRGIGHGSGREFAASWPQISRESSGLVSDLSGKQRERSLSSE